MEKTTRQINSALAQDLLGYLEEHSLYFSTLLLCRDYLEAVTGGASKHQDRAKLSRKKLILPVTAGQFLSPSDSHNVERDFYLTNSVQIKEHK